MESNLDFIYNDNYDRRGIWHITDNLEVFVVEERTRQHDGLAYRARWATKSIYVFPQHEVAKGDAICGQVSCRTGGVNMLYTPKRENTTAIFTARIRPAYYQKGLDNPPAPLCSRCAKKGGL